MLKQDFSINGLTALLTVCLMLSDQYNLTTIKAKGFMFPLLGIDSPQLVFLAYHNMYSVDIMDFPSISADHAKELSFQ